jgi:hypothetical protein
MLKEITMKLIRSIKFAADVASAPIAGLMLAGFTTYALTKKEGIKGLAKGIVVAPVVGAASTAAMVAVNIKQFGQVS